MLKEVEVRIPPTIAMLTPGVDPGTALAVEEATAAIARLDEIGRVQLGALGSFLLRSESLATSKIEHIFANLDDFARALAGQQAGTSARQMAAAVTAIGGLVADATASPINLAAINKAQFLLLQDDPLEKHAAGSPRTMQNWLGGSDFSPRGAIYVPPPPDVVPLLLNDLVDFANRTDLSPITQSAIVHAQFESIHPYTDGNGRIGRALINAVLRRRMVTTRVVVPIASALLTEVDGYFARIAAYQEGDADGFVRELARASLLAATEAAESAKALEDLVPQWRERVKPRRGSTTDLLIEHLLEAPVLTEKSVVAVTKSSRRRAYDALNRLAETEVIVEITGQPRNRVWIVQDVLDELDRLEERIGRRARPNPI
jgi:Fic family protein